MPPDTPTVTRATAITAPNAIPFLPSPVIPNQFADWPQTGHAEIFTNNLNTSPYWGSRCFGCHTDEKRTRQRRDAVDLMITQEREGAEREVERRHHHVV